MAEDQDPEPGSPDAVQPEAVQPEAVQPGAVQPQATETEPAQVDGGVPADEVQAEHGAAGAADASADDDTAPSGLAWAITTRLNRFTRKFLGPAQVGDRAPDTQVPDSLPSTPCAVCGRPLTEHELVRTTDAKMRLYCPGTPR